MKRKLVLLFLLASSVCFGQNLKISQLPAATTPLGGTELVPIVQGGVTKQVAASWIGNTYSGGSIGSITTGFGITATQTGATVNLSADTSRNPKIGIVTITYLDSVLATYVGGSVTSFSAGTLAPLFTTSVANATSTPALSFTLSNTAIGYSFFGDSTGTAAAPYYYRNLNVKNFNNGSGASSSTFWRGDGTWATPSGGGSPSLTSTYIGYGNGSNVLTGSANMVYNGYGMGLQDNSTNFNTFIGNSSGLAGNSTTTGQDNIGIGTSVLHSNTSGVNNVGLGDGSLYANTTGNDNTAIGFNIFDNGQKTGNHLTAIGNGIDVSADGWSNSIALGYNVSITTSNQFITPASVTNWTIGGVSYILPSSQGSTNTVLTNDGSGNLSWATPSGGSSSLTSTYIGYGNGSSVLTGDGNFTRSAWGINLQDNGTYQNLFIGTNTSNPAGNSTNSGSSNIGIGGTSLLSLTNGYNNTSIGYESLKANTTGAANVAIGAGALYANTTGSSNIAIGENALQSNLTGNNLVALGTGVGVSADGFSNSVAIGNGASITQTDQFVVSFLLTNWNIGGVPYVLPTSQGAANTVLTNDGSGNLSWASAGSSSLTSTYIGYGSGSNVLTGSSNLTFDGTSTLSIGVANVDINGVTYSWTNTQGAANTVLTNDGSGNLSWASAGGGSSSLTSSYIGYGSGSNVLTGDANFVRSSYGINLQDNGTTENLFIGIPGLPSGNSSVTGEGNLGMGAKTLNGLTSGVANVAIGYSTMVGNTGGSDNVAIGLEALDNNSSGSSNVAIGQFALASNNTGSYLIGIGYSADVSTDGWSNSIALGDNATITSSNQFVVAPSIVNWKIGGVAYVLPSSQGAASTVLANNGSGNLTWNDALSGTHTLHAYDNDAAAGTAGLTTGQLYQTSGSGSAPLNVAGIVMIKQ